MKNECLIDWLRFSVPLSTISHVIENILGLDYSKFTEAKSSPFPTYEKRLLFAKMEIHSSSQHSNILVNFSGQACRQYEEYMTATDGWHWHELIKVIILERAKVSRIDLALDIFDNSCPDVRKLQDYVKRGQLSSRSQTFKEINSGRILDGVLTGFTIYIGALPQMLRVYDKKQEVKHNTGEMISGEKWVRWELELSDKKAMDVAKQIATAKPLNTIIRGILSAHYAFKTQPKGKKDFANKSRWSNMKWWDKFIENIPKIPLRTEKEKSTMVEKEKWLQDGVSRSLAMQFETYTRAYGEDYANKYLATLITHGHYNISKQDESMIEQRVNELLGSKDY